MAVCVKEWWCAKERSNTVFVSLRVSLLFIYSLQALFGMSKTMHKVCINYIYYALCKNMGASPSAGLGSIRTLCIARNIH